jgi:hypothetical protein
MGREVPKELREPRRSFMEGDRLRLCMREAASLMELRVAGISTVLSALLGMGKPEPEREKPGRVLRGGGGA